MYLNTILHPGVFCALWYFKLFAWTPLHFLVKKCWDPFWSFVWLVTLTYLLNTGLKTRKLGLHLWTGYCRNSSCSLIWQGFDLNVLERDRYAQTDISVIQKGTEVTEVYTEVFIVAVHNHICHSYVNHNNQVSKIISGQSTLNFHSQICVMGIKSLVWWKELSWMPGRALLLSATPIIPLFELTFF